MLQLARLPVAGFIPAVWVPPQEVRVLRSLPSHRSRLIKQRTRPRNRLHSVLHRHTIAYLDRKAEGMSKRRDAYAHTEAILRQPHY